IGQSVRRVDGVPKVKGEFEYASDLRRDGMLWGETVRSPHPHARIKAIDIRAALESPGVRAVLLAGGGPGKKTYGLDAQDPLGPEAGLAVPAEDGGVDLYIATQWLHADLEQIAPCLNLPPEKVRLNLSGVGGAFGAREDVSMQIHACMLALRTQRPVKIAYGRQESFYGHVHRHPSRIW